MKFDILGPFGFQGYRFWLLGFWVFFDDCWVVYISRFDMVTDFAMVKLGVQLLVLKSIFLALMMFSSRQVSLKYRSSTTALLLTGRLTKVSPGPVLTLCRHICFLLHSFLKIPTRVLFKDSYCYYYFY